MLPTPIKLQDKHTKPKKQISIVFTDETVTISIGDVVLGRVSGYGSLYKLDTAQPCRNASKKTYPTDQETWHNGSGHIHEIEICDMILYNAVVDLNHSSKNSFRKCATCIAGKQA